ncbi:hypothetical protein L3V18_18610 [Lysobacter sp. TLK-CK17T]|uniref:Uncharacterized protein n=1 Tax=Marilutibacter chinensis TaxID=2912247 RepID=A0ABS9I003_9GAMM|nr:hypothetical protein [Lysobacter chinensis]
MFGIDLHLRSKGGAISVLPAHASSGNREKIDGKDRVSYSRSARSTLALRRRSDVDIMPM